MELAVGRPLNLPTGRSALRGRGPGKYCRVGLVCTALYRIVPHCTALRAAADESKWKMQKIGDKGTPSPRPSPTRRGGTVWPSLTNRVSKVAGRRRKAVGRPTRMSAPQVKHVAKRKIYWSRLTSVATPPVRRPAA